MKKAQGLPFPHYYTEQYSSGVPRVSSAQGPMLASAPPPPKKISIPRPPHRPTWLVPSGLGVRPPRLASATALCNEVTLLSCLGLIFFLQLGPTSWGGGAPPRLAPGAMAPLPPLPRHCNIVGLLKSFKSVEGCYLKTPIDDCGHSICTVNHQAKLYG